MKKCLITGATGLIGAQLRQALPQDWQVFAVARSPLIATQRQPATQIALDLSTDWNPAALPPQIDAIIHLAQSENFREFPDRALDIFQVNTLSTLRLLDYARQAGAQTFILASSGGVYGHHEQVLSEDEALTAKVDLGFYAGTKLCAEILAENYTAYMNMIMARFFFVYGAEQRKSMLIPRLVQSVLEGRTMTLQGQDGIRINPTHVADAADALVRMLALQGSHKINVGGPEVLSMRQIGETIGQVIGRTPQFVVQPDVQPRHLVGDIQKMTRLLGAPQVKFAAGIQQLLAQEKA